MANDAPIATDVGWAVEGDNLFRGRSVRDELVGHHDYWSTVSLAAGGPALSAEEARFLDALAVCFNAADPRIWPLKLTWLGSCHGSPFAGMSTALCTLDYTRVGPAPVAMSAHLLQELHALVDASEGQPRQEVLSAWLHNQRSLRQRVPGFGVIARAYDERSELMKQAAVSFGRDGGRYFRLLIALETLGREILGLPINAGLTYAACLLDLEMKPAHTSLAAFMALCVPMLANARDGALLQPASLRAMPADYIRYEGVAPRISHRKAAADLGAYGGPA